MFSAKKFWGALTSVVLASVGLVATSLPANAYATAPTLGSGSTSTTTSTSALASVSTGSSYQKYAFDNGRGGVVEIGGAAVNSHIITLRSYNDGVLDTAFNGTGEATITSALFNDTSPWRLSVEFTTYNGGANWMLLEHNASTNSGLNYFYLGTYTGG